MTWEFTNDDLERPIFIDPPDDIGRQDAWSGPYAFLLGGMGSPQKYEIAQEYFNAANSLVASIRRQEIEDYAIANPVLFLYRHSIELMLKAAIGLNNEHDLGEMTERLEQKVKDKFGQNTPHWLISRLKEISDIDPRSTSFRYAVKRSGKNGIVLEELGGEHYIDLHHLQRAMIALFSALATIVGLELHGRLPEVSL